MMPRVLLRRGGITEGCPVTLAIRVESVVDFVGRHGLFSEIEGGFGDAIRRTLISEEGGTRFQAIERLGCRDLIARQGRPGLSDAVTRVRELWRMRRRDFES
jgi:hypothetical protein